jgi:Flp pilus assembly protein TadG
MRRLIRRRLGEERGAVAVMVALLLVPLLGFAAIAVDVAAVHAERQALRNGADAAALAIATDCARDACGDTVRTATTLVGANSGSVGATLATPTVQVNGPTVTLTATAAQQHWFAPMIGVESSTVGATSTAAWTGMNRATAVLPLAISWCEYQARTLGDPVRGSRHRVVALFSGGRNSCAGPTGTAVPGGFAWVDTDPGQGCQATSTVGELLTEHRAFSIINSVPRACWDSAYLNGLIGDTIYIPVFDQKGGRGTDTWYRVYGYAAFQLNGYASGPLFWILSSLGIDPGLQGFFTTSVELSDAPVPPSAPDLGARSVFLTERNPQ